MPLRKSGLRRRHPLEHGTAHREVGREPRGSKGVLHRIRRSDIEAVRALYRATYDPQALGFTAAESALANQYVAESLATDMSDPYVHYTRTPKSAFFVIESSGSIVGMCGIDVWPGDYSTAELKRVGVHPQYRRQGLGRRLVERAERWSFAQDFRAMRLYTLDAFEAAIRLYESLGFSLVGTHQWGPLSGREYQKTIR